MEWGVEKASCAGGNEWRGPGRDPGVGIGVVAGDSLKKTLEGGESWAGRLPVLVSPQSTSVECTRAAILVEPKASIKSSFSPDKLGRLTPPSNIDRTLQKSWRSVGEA